MFGMKWSGDLIPDLCRPVKHPRSSLLLLML